MGGAVLLFLSRGDSAVVTAAGAADGGGGDNPHPKFVSLG